MNYNNMAIVPDSRSLYIGGIDPTCSHSDIFHVLRGGIVESVRILREKSCAFVSFVDHQTARICYDHLINAHPSGLIINNKQVKIGWGGRSMDMSPQLKQSILDGATRSIYLGAIPLTFTAESILQDLTSPPTSIVTSVDAAGKKTEINQGFGIVESVKVVDEKRCAFVSFTCIQDSIKALQILQSLSTNNFKAMGDNGQPLFSNSFLTKMHEWRNVKLNYGKDLCDRPGIMGIKSNIVPPGGMVGMYAQQNQYSQYPPQYDPASQYNMYMSQYNNHYQGQMPYDMGISPYQQNPYMQQSHHGYSASQYNSQMGNSVTTYQAPMPSQQSDVTSNPSRHDVTQHGDAVSTYQGPTPPKPNYTHSDAQQDNSISTYQGPMPPQQNNANQSYQNSMPPIGNFQRVPPPPIRYPPPRPYFPEQHNVMNSGPPMMNYGARMGMRPAMRPMHNNLSKTFNSANPPPGLFVPTSLSELHKPSLRTIYIGGLAPNTTASDVCSVIRAKGNLFRINMVPSRNCAFLTFVDPASARVVYLNANPQNFPGAQPQGGLHINGANVKVNFGKEAGLSRSVMEVVKKGGTRNLYLSGVMVNEDLENGAVCNVGADGIAIRSFRMETIQQDFARFGELEKIHALPEKKTLLINYCHLLDATRALEALKCGTLTNLINGFNNLHLKNNSGTKAEPENDVDNEHEEPKNDPPSTVTEDEVVKEVKFEESDKEKDKLNADIESEGIIVNPLPNSNISHSIIGQKRKSETAENSPMSKNKEEEASVLPEHQEIVDPVSLTNPSTLPSTVNADDAASVSGEKVGSGGGSITSALNYLPREVDPELEIHCKTVFDRYQGVKASYGRDRVAGDPKSF